MEKMIYLMNVDWNWIKQRPHFIAEELRKHYDLTIVNQQRYSRKGLQKRALNDDIFVMRVIPRIDRYKGLRQINVILKRNIIRRLIKTKQPEYIYITDPNQVEWIPSEYEGKLIYDCMDDHIGLSRDNDKKKQIERNEGILAGKADYIFFSSAFLRTLFHRRYAVPTSAKEGLIRNGYNGDICDIAPVPKKEKFTICYFGTISDWFDFDVIGNSLEKFENLEYLLIGPLHRNVTIPDHERIRYAGTVEHAELAEMTKEVDCFVMPFKLDDSIRAVDPVKLYEYINFGKNIICVEYDEIERFSDYVYFYRDKDEYLENIAAVMKGNDVKYNHDQRIKLLNGSSWAYRCQQITEIMDAP